MKWIARLASMLMVAAACTSQASAKPKPVVIAIAGDSTVETTAEGSTPHGWGQYLGQCFDSNVRVVNLAKAGRSTKTFIEEGLWQKTLASQPTYVLIQFGHNDSHTPDHHEHTDAAGEYRTNLERMVDEARAAGAIPVLITPVRRRTRDDNLVPYSATVEIVAKEKSVAFLDLHDLSDKFYKTLSPEQITALQAGGKDVTHFSATGAEQIMRIVSKEMARLVPQLKEHYLCGGAQGT